MEAFSIGIVRCQENVGGFSDGGVAGVGSTPRVSLFSAAALLGFTGWYASRYPGNCLAIFRISVRWSLLSLERLLITISHDFDS